MRVVLTEMEMAIATMVGKARRADSLRRGLSPKSGYDRADPEAVDIQGAAGEMASAKGLNYYWEAPVGNFKLPDVDEYQVRHTWYDKGRLIIRDNDKLGEYYILVTGIPPILELRGWIRGTEAAQHPEWLDGYGGRKDQWFCPQQFLHDIGALINPIEQLIRPY